jgi:prolyl oligopeptidase
MSRQALRPRPLQAKASFVALVVLFVTMVATPTFGVAKQWQYPEAKKGTVVDDYHGTSVPDPYRWLEDPNSPETTAWVEAENELTHSYIDTEPSREAVKKRLEEIWNYPKYSLPTKKGDRYFFSKNDGLQNQSVLYMQTSLDGDADVVIDPNKLSDDGTVALRNEAFSDDGTLLAYGLSRSGSDWQEIKIRNVDTGKDYPEVIEFVKFAGIAWKKDKSGFYYNRFPDPGSVPDEDQNNYSRVYWHKLGTPQSEDVLVYEDRSNEEVGFSPYMTDDGDYLCLYVYHGTDSRNGIYYRKSTSDGDFVKLFEVGEAKFEPIDNVGPVFYFETDLDAPRGRVVAVDVTKPDRADWVEVLPQGDDVIDRVQMVNDELVVAVMHDAHHKMSIYRTNGDFQREMDLPAIGSVGGLSGDRKDTEMFFSFSSFLYPSTAFRYDFKTDKVTVFRKPEIDFDSSKYETKQVFFKSKDGTKVPMFITCKKGLKLDGSNPTLLYGYGGFNISLTPYFSITRAVWMESGGVFALANIRGGDEYGEEWHRAGMLGNKQHVFDDFIAAGEWLVANKYTSKARLAIEGGSNGGLLVAACEVQRPDLFGAAICRVPVTDMLRYQKFTVGRYWVPEYGNAEENPEDFKFLYAYSPLHNVKPGVTYPPTLITTADTDDRVVPSHAKKFAATMQAEDSGKNPILIRIETKAGHGGGKPTSKIIDETSDIFAFLFKTFGMSAPVVGKN